MTKRHEILLIEQDRLLAGVYKNYLDKLDYKVQVCGTVQDALNEIDKSRPDIIILEPQLSTHNGFEFLYELRSYPEWQDIPVLIQSIVPEEEIKLSDQAKKELGVLNYLYKPSTSLEKLHNELSRGLLINT